MTSTMRSWLMLPPTFDGEGNYYHNLYNLAGDKVESFKSDHLPPHADESTFVGSSHGWLAFVQKQVLFLSNPLTNRLVKLPPQLSQYHPVARLILSNGAEEEDCRAVVAFRFKKGLAFCYPPPPHSRNDSSDQQEWTDVIFAGEEWYEDFVYSSTQNVVFCITGFKPVKPVHLRLYTPSKLYDFKLDVWDIHDHMSPKIVSTRVFSDPRLSPSKGKYDWHWSDRELPYIRCWHLRYLVLDKKSNHLFLVIRKVNPHMGPDGQYVELVYNGRFLGLDWQFPYQTTGFEVCKVDMESGELRWCEGHLDGLSMFIGMNHSFAVAGAFLGLKPDSIYFTDEPSFILPKICETDFGGHDIGVFNYHDTSFSSCYYPREYDEIQRIIPPPMWFLSKPFKLPTIMRCRSSDTAEQVNDQTKSTEAASVGVITGLQSDLVESEISRDNITKNGNGESQQGQTKDESTPITLESEEVKISNPALSAADEKNEVLCDKSVSDQTEKTLQNSDVSAKVSGPIKTVCEIALSDETLDNSDAYVAVNSSPEESLLSTPSVKSDGLTEQSEIEVNESRNLEEPKDSYPVDRVSIQPESKDVDHSEEKSGREISGTSEGASVGPTLASNDSTDLPGSREAVDLLESSKTKSNSPEPRDDGSERTFEQLDTVCFDIGDVIVTGVDSKSLEAEVDNVKLTSDKVGVAEMDLSANNSSSRADSLEGNCGSVSDTFETDYRKPKATTTEEAHAHAHAHHDKSVSEGSEQVTAVSEIEIVKNNQQQPKSDAPEVGWFPSQTNVLNQSEGRKKNEEIIAKVTKWSPGKELPNKVTGHKTDESKDDCAGADVATTDTAVVVGPFDPKNVQAKDMEQWYSPARYPIEIKKETKKKKGRSLWVPFVCCYSVH